MGANVEFVIFAALEVVDVGERASAKLNDEKQQRGATQKQFCIISNINFISIIWFIIFSLEFEGRAVEATRRRSETGI